MPARRRFGLQNSNVTSHRLVCLVTLTNRRSVAIEEIQFARGRSRGSVSRSQRIGGLRDADPEDCKLI